MKEDAMHKMIEMSILRQAAALDIDTAVIKAVQPFKLSSQGKFSLCHVKWGCGC